MFPSRTRYGLTWFVCSEVDVILKCDLKYLGSNVMLMTNKLN